MKRPSNTVLSNLAVIRFRLNRLPLRLFHGALLGMALGTVFSIGAHMIGSALLEDNPSAVAAVTPEPQPAPAPRAFLSGEADSDNDGIPNTWETQFGHNPDNATDAASDFDNDGLTAAQEYQLSLDSNGQNGNPLGNWTVETADLAGLVATLPPSTALRVVDVNNSGTVLLQSSDGLIERAWTVSLPADGSTPVITEITYPYNPSANIRVYDINDNGTVASTATALGDWMPLGFLWTDGVVEPLGNGFAKRINNRGNWVGFSYDGCMWSPTAVIGSYPWTSYYDWTGYLSNPLFGGLPVFDIVGINENDQVLGIYTDFANCQTTLAVAWNGWVEAAGFPVAYPESPSPWGYNEALINGYGEFATARMLGTSYQGCYFFDGATAEFGGDRVTGLSDKGLVVSEKLVSSWDQWSAREGVFAWADGVQVDVRRLQLPETFGTVAHLSAAVSGSGIIAVSNGSAGAELVLLKADDDADGDGMSDDWEALYNFDPTDGSDAFLDLDGDGVDNYGEFLLRSDPANPPAYGNGGQVIDTRPGIDTDGDGIPNVWEWENGLDYQDASDAPLDYDRDGFTNLQEFNLNTDPRGAPSYRVRKIGPFDGMASVSLQSAVLGAGRPAGECLTVTDSEITESLFFEGTPSAGPDVRRPVRWSQSSTGTGFIEAGQTAQGADASSWSHVATAPGGASVWIGRNGGIPYVYHWAHAAATPVGMSGLPTACNVGSLYSYSSKLSPSGSYLAGSRCLTNPNGVWEPFVWRMPTSPTTTTKPLKLVPPSGLTLGSSPTLWVNDHGYALANCIRTSNGKSTPVLWKVNGTGTGIASVQVLAPLDASAPATVAGLSNHPAPIIAGWSNFAGQPNQAVVWTSSGAPTPLGVLGGGNSSEITAISPGGYLAGKANVYENGELRYQVVTAKPAISPGDLYPDPSLYRLLRNGDSGGNSIAVTMVNDAGEVLGQTYQYSPVYLTIPTIWRHGRAFPLPDLLPPVSGYTLLNCGELNSNGTILATALKDGLAERVLITPDRDADGDGLPDSVENANQLNPYQANPPGTDTDGDGLRDLDELRLGTGIGTSDTDGDGMNDAWETAWGLLPLDPSDASLDPDGDHVSNLRESQLGTNPTGVWRIENTWTATAGESPALVADSGHILLSGNAGEEISTTESGIEIYHLSSEYRLLTPGFQGLWEDLPELVDSESYSAVNPNCSYPDFPAYQTYRDRVPVYRINPASGAVHGLVFTNFSEYDINWQCLKYVESALMIPDCRSMGLAQGISWQTIQQNLRWTTELVQYVDENGNPVEESQVVPGPLGAEDELWRSPVAWSQTGNRGLFQSLSGGLFVLDETGAYVGTVPNSQSWQAINSRGEVAALNVGTEVNGENGGVEEVIRLVTASTGSADVRAVTVTGMGLCPLWAVSFEGWSDDGIALLKAPVANSQGMTGQAYYLVDTASGSTSQVRRSEQYPDALLSRQNRWILGKQTSAPFINTPDGTCVKLGALRIRNTPADTEVPLSSAFPDFPIPLHISSTGTITAVTWNASYQQVILRIAPNDDMDNDGIPDDWEKHWAQVLLRTLVQADLSTEVLASLNAGDLDAAADYLGEGVANEERFRDAIATTDQSGFSIECKSRGILLGNLNTGPDVNPEEQSYVWMTNYDDDNSNGSLFVKPGITNTLPSATFDYLDDYVHWDSIPWRASSSDRNIAGPGWPLTSSMMTLQIGTSVSCIFDYNEGMLRIRTNMPSLHARTFKFLVVTQSVSKSDQSVTWAAPETEAITTISLTMPKNATRSNAVMVSTPLKENRNSLTKVVAAELIPDFNRDGKIDAEDRGRATQDSPWRFWVNDDNDSGEAGGDDIPSESSADATNCLNNQADGARDMIDFFPLQLDLSEIFELLPPEKYYYRVTQNAAQNDPCIKVMFAKELLPGNCDAYLREFTSSVAVCYRQTHPVNSFGPNLPDEFISAVREGKGLLLVEGVKATTMPLEITIKTKPAGSFVHSITLPLSIAGVEDMFRYKWLDEDPLGGTQGGVPASPSNWPDSDRNGKHLIFLHGYNVSGTQARGTFSEVFKRFFWCGSNAMFTGIAWHGNEAQFHPSVPVVGGADPDYWSNVTNAFRTAPSVKDFVTDPDLPGASKHIAAHSLGNMVVSSAIADHGLQVADYFMLNAAVPVEAYSTGAKEQSNMVAPAWRNTYKTSLRASEWHKLFPKDARHGLTWRGRFGAFPNAWNFHSSGEEVLRNCDASPPGTWGVVFSHGVLSWAKQEHGKGDDLAGGGALYHGQGGWEFNSAWDLPALGPVRHTRTPVEADSLTGAHISVTPFFKPFRVTALMDPTLGAAAANDLDNRAITLAEAIPATTFAAGSNPIPAWPDGRNFDMPTELSVNGWPAVRTGDEDPRKQGWRHGDFRDVAFLYTHRVYEKITELANLNQTTNP